MTLRDFYPPIEPFSTFRLQASPLHNLYVEQAGNPKGQPVVFLHGGPGGGISADHRRYFNPEKWHIILFDQRGCGKSTPHASLEDNTTWHLVEDIEKIRQQLGIEKWHVFGGSWGSTLALAYALKHSERVLGLILRGIFLVRKKEILWTYQHGASEIFPDAWEKYVAPIPPNERHDFLAAYHKRLVGLDKQQMVEAAIAWSVWEATTAKLFVDPEMIEETADPEFATAFARIECHYFKNRGFFETDGWILENAHRLANIPGVIVQGRYDVVCPTVSAWDLHKAWPKAKLEIISDAGHAASEPGIRDALIRATDHFSS